MKKTIDGASVSVIIPTYNRAHLIGRAIRSVLNQSYQNLEIIVVDDCSTDETKKVINTIREDAKRVRYIIHEKNMGGSAARNTGIKAANGKFIAFLDDDDEWQKDKLAKQIDKIKTLTNEWGAVYCGYYLMNKRVSTCEAIKNGNLTKDILFGEMRIGGSSTLLFTKEAIERTGLFDESFERHQDYEYLLRFFRNYKLASIKDPLVKIYGHNIPNGEKLAKVKSYYLSKFNEDIIGFGEKTAAEIFARQWLEIAEIFALECHIDKCLYYLKISASYKRLPLKNYADISSHIIIGLLSKLKAWISFAGLYVFSWLVLWLAFGDNPILFVPMLPAPS